MFDLSLTGGEGARVLGEFRFQLVAHRWADEVEPMLLDGLRRRAPVSRGPAAGRTAGRQHLRDSFRAQRHLTPLNVGISVYSTAPYARYVMSGTRPHTIAPRRAKALYWVDGRGSHFARLVHHPGTKPNTFARDTMRALRPILAARLESQVRRALQVR